MANHKQKRQKIPRGLILELAWKDLRHEWILSLCLVMAVTAVLGPLLILFGLKFGSIQILRNRLIDDPRNSEIRPMITRSFSQQWFKDISKRGDVQFVVPMTRQISTSVEACVAEGNQFDCKNKEGVDLLPTAENDPLLLQNGSEIPTEEECVLTTRAAEKLQAKPGDTLNISVRRIIGGKYEKSTLRLSVKAVLASRAGTTKAMFVRLPVLEAVEQYKDGAAVPAYGWPGKQMTAHPLFDGVFIHLSKPLRKVEEVMLKNNTGFSKIENLSPQELREQTSISINAPGSLYLISTRKNPVGNESIEAVRHRLRGKNATIIPWVKPFSASFTDESGATREVTVLSAGYSQKIAQQLEIQPAPGWAALEDDPNVLQGFTTTGDTKQHGLLSTTTDGRTLQVPLTVTGQNTDRNEIYLPTTLSGIFRLLEKRLVIYDETQKTFLLSRKGYAGFRLYASSIEEVDGLRLFFESRGIQVATQADRIRDVQELNYYLTLIFWLIAATGAIGGTATLAASLYASVERKRRDIAILRLIGLSRSTLLRFPIYQGILLNLCGLSVAFGFFAGLSRLINYLFQSMLSDNESLCVLYPQHISSFILLVGSIAIISATAAAMRVTRLEPVEALRDE